MPHDSYALLTSPGPAAIAVLELRGTGVPAWAAARLSTRTPLENPPAGSVHRATLRAADGEPLDDVVVTIRPAHDAPRLWLHLHGGPAIVRACCELLAADGFQADEATAAAIWDLPDPLTGPALDLLSRMTTQRGVAWLLKDLERRRALLARAAPADRPAALQELLTPAPAAAWFTTPLRVALLGPPNAGKSTLANALADQPVSLVSPRAGTTRDWIEIAGELDGFPVVWLDTPGIRPDADPIEAAAIELAAIQIAAADARLLILDATDPAGGEAFIRTLSARGGPGLACIALNKCDDPGADAASLAVRIEDLGAVVSISAQERSGLNELARALWRSIGRDVAGLAGLDAAAPE